MTIEELMELVHLLLMCGIKDKSALESGNITNEEWLRMMGLIDKYQSEKPGPEKMIQTPSCLTNPERHEELLERYKEGEYGER